MTVLYDESPEAVVEALAEAARALPVLVTVDIAVDGLVATEQPGGNEGVLTVTVERQGELTAAHFDHAYVPRDRDAWAHLPSEVLREAERRGLHGAAVAQARGYTEAEGCPEAEDLARSGGEAAPDSFALAVDKREPVLIGGLAGVAGRVQYPSLARRAGIAGTAVARFVVDEAGGVRCAEVVGGLPGGINEEVLRIVGESRFEPGMLDGEPVSVRFLLPVTFWLR